LLLQGLKAGARNREVQGSSPWGGIGGEMPKMLMVYITFPSKKDAEKIAKMLLERKIAVCCNIFSIKSLYWWKGKIENTREAVMIAKTLKSKANKLINFVKNNHPYTVPFIGVINVEANKEYFNWAKSTLK
jgi:periplasmic divalent cation tolerance protein